VETTTTVVRCREGLHALPWTTRLQSSIPTEVHPAQPEDMELHLAAGAARNSARAGALD
jgi:hypothetical protein